MLDWGGLTSIAVVLAATTWPEIVLHLGTAATDDGGDVEAVVLDAPVVLLARPATDDELPQPAI